MFTIKYNGMYINGYHNSKVCYVTDDTNHFKGRQFNSLHAAKIAITKARKAGVPESR